jgi:hypothetical protein
VGIVEVNEREELDGTVGVEPCKETIGDPLGGSPQRSCRDCLLARKSESLVVSVKALADPELRSENIGTYEPGSGVAVSLQDFGKRKLAVAEREPDVFPDTVMKGVCSRQEGRVGGKGQGIISVGSLEPDSLRGPSVDFGSLVQLVAVAAQAIGTQSVHADEQDVVGSMNGSEEADQQTDRLDQRLHTVGRLPQRGGTGNRGPDSQPASPRPALQIRKARLCVRPQPRLVIRMGTRVPSLLTSQTSGRTGRCEGHLSYRSHNRSSSCCPGSYSDRRSDDG